MRCAAFSRLQFALFGVILLAASEARAQRPLNLGFERLSNGDASRPWGWTWFGGPAGTTVALDSLEHRSGSRSLRMSRPAADSGAGAGDVATLRLFIPPLSARGRTVRVTAWAKTRDAAAGARFSLEAWTYGAVLAADSGDAWQTGTSDWARIERSVPVDSSAHAVVITLQFRGSGSVWFDDLVISMDGRSMESVPVAPTPAQADREWMTRNTWPLRTADADGGDDRDLDAFRRIVGDARVISLGEDTHGTSEHFRMKHRLTRYMVEQMGARVFAIEANQLAVEPINRYVREGVGEVGQVMRGMFAVWNTEEMKAMIEWMRAHNAAHPSAMVSFVGYDMQDPSLPIDSLRAFLTRRDPALLPAADRAYTPYREAWRKSAYPQAADSVRQGWRTSAESMWREVSARATTWLNSSRSRDDSASVEWAIQNANVVRQAALAAVSGRLGDRDSAMAANIDWILSRHGDKGRVVVWAHNGHVARDPDPKLGIFGGMSMGTYLSARLSQALRVFGLVSYEGQYRGTMTAGDRRFIDVEAVPAPIGSIEEVLHGIATRSGAGYLVADLRAARSEAGGRWLLTPRPTRMIGYAAADFDWEQMVVLPRVFDALVFVDRATASRGIVR